MPRRFRQVDVFASAPLSGNPLAVVVDAHGLDDGEMMAFARWTNLSETTFLLPPTDDAADYLVRIFTHQRELPFAGHPTLGSASVWLASGGTPRRDDVVVQQCGVGLVEVRRSGDRLSFAAPPLQRGGPVDDELVADLRALLGLSAGDVVDAAWVDNGPGWVGLLVGDVEVLRGIRPARHRWTREQPVDVGVAARVVDGDRRLEVRAFFDDHLGRLLEDPVTGSLNASLAQWLLGSGRLDAPYVARQGTVLGRDGAVYVEQDADGTIWVGGRVRHHVRGEVELP